MIAGQSRGIACGDRGLVRGAPVPIGRQSFTIHLSATIESGGSSTNFQGSQETMQNTTSTVARVARTGALRCAGGRQDEEERHPVRVTRYQRTATELKLAKVLYWPLQARTSNFGIPFPSPSAAHLGASVKPSRMASRKTRSAKRGALLLDTGLCGTPESRR